MREAKELRSSPGFLKTQTLLSAELKKTAGEQIEVFGAGFWTGHVCRTLLASGVAEAGGQEGYSSEEAVEAVMRGVGSPWR